MAPFLILPAKWREELNSFERKQVLFISRVALYVANPESQDCHGLQLSDMVARKPSASKVSSSLPIASHLPPLIKFYPSFSFRQPPK